MVREFWIRKIKSELKIKSVLWLTGVRRSGKTTLCRSLVGQQLYDCELPRIRQLLTDPEDFFRNCKAELIALDEIHRLDNPAEVLKIAADYFPHIKVIATGSSTLHVTKKFKDSLTDRKRTLLLTPLNSNDLGELKKNELVFRLLRGGLPPFFLAKHFPESEFQDWLDSFWAKDIEELFRINSKSSFLKFFELLALQSGSIFEANKLAAPCSVSHTTIANYLRVMELTHIAYVLRPFHKRASKETIAAPKIYFFDTGFINFFHGRTELHTAELGQLWEHFVLNELLAHFPSDSIHYWRDKQKNEIDFVIKRRGKDPVAIECKWQSKDFTFKALRAFRQLHPKGKNFLVTAISEPSVTTDGLSAKDVRCVNLQQLMKALLAP